MRCYSDAFDGLSCLNLNAPCLAITSIHIAAEKSEKGVDITVQCKICLPTIKMLSKTKISMLNQGSICR